MHDAAYARAARPAPRCILRLPMLPYSIGHELILNAADNPIVTLPEEQFNDLPMARQISAILTAALVCSRNYADNSKPERWLRLWFWTIRNANYPLAIAEFRIYRAEGSAVPPITPPEFSEIPPEENALPSRTIGCPLLARLINFLASRPSSILHPPSSIEDYPMGRALFEYFSSLEEQGRVQVENADEQETRESFEANRAAILAEREDAAKQTQPGTQ